MTRKLVPFVLCVMVPIGCGSSEQNVAEPADTGARDTTVDAPIDSAAADTGVPIADSAADTGERDALLDSTSDASDANETAVDAAVEDGVLGYAKGYGASGYDGVLTAVFSGSDLYIGGDTTGAATLDPAKPISPYAFIARIDGTGKAQWTMSMNATYIGVGAFAVMGTGDILAAINFRGSVNVKGTTYNSAGGIDILLVSISPLGNVINVKQYGGSSDERVNSLAIDSTGRIAVGGHYQDTGSFGGATFATSKGGSDAFVALLDTSWNRLASVAYGGPTDDSITAVAFDPTGNVVAAGYMTGTVDFGGGVTMSSAGGSDAALISMSASGTVTRAKRWGSAATDGATSVAIDSAGRAWLGGYFSSGADFGGGSLSASGIDAFVLGVDASWNYVSAWKYGDTGYDSVVGLGFGPGGDLLVAGNFTTSVSFGGATKTSLGSTDIFTARITTTGTPKWVARYGGMDGERAYYAAVDPVGGIGLVGTFAATTTFDTTTLAAVASNDGFYARVLP